MLTLPPITEILDNSKVSQDEDGIWRSPQQSRVSYPHDGNESCFQIEERSFWFRHRNRVIVSLVRRYLAEGSTLFDVGGGNGFVSAHLNSAGLETVLVEPGKTGASNALQRGVKLVVCSTLEDAGFPDGSLPAVGLFDVIEHIKDDVGFLDDLRHLLVPGGKVFITVPAYRCLWSSEDTHAGHFRRYRRGTLRQTLAKAGFEVEFISYFFCFLPIPILFLRTLPSLLGIRRSSSMNVTTREHNVATGFGSAFVDRMLKQELAQIDKGRTIWCGGSCVAVATAIT